MFSEKKSAFVTLLQPNGHYNNIFDSCSSCSHVWGSIFFLQKPVKSVPFLCVTWNCHTVLQSGYLIVMRKKIAPWMNIFYISVLCLSACIWRGCLNTFSGLDCMSWRNDNRCQLNRESKCLPQAFLFCSQRSLACGWDCTTTTQHQLNSSSCEHLLFCGLHCGKSVYITKAQVSISLVWVYFSPIFPVWNIHKKCPWTCLFWEANSASSFFYVPNVETPLKTFICGRKALDFPRDWRIRLYS